MDDNISLSTPPPLRGCYYHIVRDCNGVDNLAAIVPNGIPLVFSGEEWQLASPLIAEMIKRSVMAKRKEKADANPEK